LRNKTQLYFLKNLNFLKLTYNTIGNTYTCRLFYDSMITRSKIKWRSNDRSRA